MPLATKKGHNGRKTWAKTEDSVGLENNELAVGGEASGRAVHPPEVEIF